MFVLVALAVAILNWRCNSPIDLVSFWPKFCLLTTTYEEARSYHDIEYTDYKHHYCCGL